MNNDATPDGTLWMAQNKPPWPPRNIMAPITAAMPHSPAVGRDPPRQRPQAYSALPAVTDRTPASMSGGIDSTPIFMARYAEPHTR
jgi:hypothetical protein